MNATKTTLTALTGLALFAGSANAAVITLTGDTANSSPNTALHNSTPDMATALTNLTNDGFAYNPDTYDDTTGPQPYTNGAHMHGSNNSLVTVAWDFDGTYNNLFIDIWGKGDNADRDDNFDIQWWKGGVLQHTQTGGLPNTGGLGSRHERFTAPGSMEADHVRLVETGTPNYFSLSEMRVNGDVVPEPGSLALLGLGGLLVARRRRG